MRLVAVLALALPVSTFLIGIVPTWRWPVPVTVLLLLAVTGGLAALAFQLRRVPLGPPMAMAALTVAVLVVDLLTGGRLQINTLLGYSPVVAGRFQGIGNLAFALLAAGTLMTAAWIVLVRGIDRTTTIALGALFGGVLIANGAPPFGSDVGGILATVPAYGVAFQLLRGRRIDWRRIAVLVLILVAVLAVAALVDVARPASERTHLGRLVDDMRDNGIGPLLTVVHRKAQANINLLKVSTFTYLIPFLMAFVALLLYRPLGLMAELVGHYPVLRPTLIAVLLAAGLGFGLNDSGVAVAAMMGAVVAPVLMYALTTLPPRYPPSRTRRFGEEALVAGTGAEVPDRAGRLVEREHGREEAVERVDVVDGGDARSELVVPAHDVDERPS
jgi:hypothetical protein